MSHLPPQHPPCSVYGPGNEEGPILALTTGFVAPPFRLMHCDTLQVFTSRCEQAQALWVPG